MRHRLLVALLALAVSAPLAAQTESNLYLPISSWATPYVEHLVRAGVLTGLDPLTRPLRRADVARAVAAVDTTKISASALSLVRLLARELEERPDSVRWRLEENIALLGASDARRWSLRPSLDSGGLYVDSAGIFPEAGLTASLELPHLALVTHPRIDNRLKYDPDYRGEKDRVISGRNDEAYVITSWRYLDVFFGIAARNWGPPEIEGLALSTSPLPFDHLMVRLGPRRLRLEALAAQLDPLPLWDAVRPVNRYLSLHRLIAIPSEHVAVSLFEAAVYGETGGIPRSWELWYLNPVNSYLVAQFTGPETTANLFAGADVSVAVGRGVRLFGQLLADDFQIDTDTTTDREPPAYAATIGASGGALRGTLSWSGLYTRVSNVAYRTPAREEQYTRYGVGLARNFSDYDQATLRVTVSPRPRALVTGELTYLRQGEGDIRERFPPIPAYDDSLTFLTGVVEKTVRLAAQLAWSPVAGVNLTADVGRHFITNAGHLAGTSDGRWVWRVRGEIRRRQAGALRW